MSGFDPHYWRAAEFIVGLDVVETVNVLRAHWRWESGNKPGISRRSRGRFQRPSTDGGGSLDSELVRRRGDASGGKHTSV